MPLKPAEREDLIRPLAAAGLSTRKIKKITGIPQSTVARDVKRMRTGPNPAIPPEQLEQPAQKAPRLPSFTMRIVRQISWITVLIMILVVSGAAIGSFTWLYVTHSRDFVTICVQYSPTRVITGLAAAAAGHCGADWHTLVLTPGK